MKNHNCNKKIFTNYNKKKLVAEKSINNYLSQLQFHFELTDTELYDILKLVISSKKLLISSKKWWRIFH